MTILKTIKRSFIISACACLAACASISKKIDRDILDEQGVYENEKIENIELKIISVKEEADTFKSLAKIASLNISVTDKNIKILTLEKLVLKEKEKLYTLLAKPDKKREAQKKVKLVKKESAYQKIKLDYLDAKLEDLKNLVRLKELELDLKIAQRLLEKAKLAKDFKKEEAPGQYSPISIVKYELSYKEKEQTFFQYKREREQTAAALKKAESQFRPFLKKDECETVKKLMGI